MGFPPPKSWQPLSLRGELKCWGEMLCLRDWQLPLLISWTTHLGALSPTAKLKRPPVEALDRHHENREGPAASSFPAVPIERLNIRVRLSWTIQTGPATSWGSPSDPSQCHIEQESCSTKLCLNFWLTQSWAIIKWWLFYATGFGPSFLHSNK